jgi:predicted RNA-binding Zn-ribbon protein involved in translation (DUF1610 family)
MSDFNCPKCGESYEVGELELWEVYDEDGKETEMTCEECDSDMIITSQVTGWTFSTEERE